MADHQTHDGRELSRFIRQNAPGHSLWYGRLAMERLIFDEIDLALDPKARQRFRNIETRARRDYKQRFFSRPGRGLPQRAPDLSQAVREAGLRGRAGAATLGYHGHIDIEIAPGADHHHARRDVGAPAIL